MLGLPFKKWWRGRRESSPSSVVRMESLESRKLLSGGPILTGVHLVGTVHATTAVVLTFNESLDPATAQDVHAYRLGRTPPSSSSGTNIGDILGFLARPKARAIINGKIQFASAVYDDSTHSVTLTPIKPFRANTYFRTLRVFGTGANAVKDLAGNPLDGNGDGTGGDDAVTHWNFRSGKRIRYLDSDGDTIFLTLRRHGQLFAFLPTTGPRAVVLYVDRPASNTTVTGVIVPGPHGDGNATFGEIEGIGGIQNNLIGNPRFTVESTAP